MQEEILQVQDIILNIESRVVTRGSRKTKLSPHECNLLIYLLKNAGKAVTRDRLLQKIWNYQPDIESRVVDVYMGYLRRKLDIGSHKIIKTVRGKGYMIEF